MPLSDDTPRPWLSIVGIGEDGLEGLSETARDLLSQAELVAGGSRHLALAASLGKATLEWDTPFSASISKTPGASRPASRCVVFGRSLLVWRGLDLRGIHFLQGDHRDPGAFDLCLGRSAAALAAGTARN